MTNSERPAYPTEVAFHDGKLLESNQTSERTGTFPGLTKRELFAAMFMQGMMAHPGAGSQRDGSPMTFEVMASQCIKASEIFIKQLES